MLIFSALIQLRTLQVLYNPLFATVRVVAGLCHGGQVVSLSGAVLHLPRLGSHGTLKTSVAIS